LISKKVKRKMYKNNLGKYKAVHLLFVFEEYFKVQECIRAEAVD